MHLILYIKQKSLARNTMILLAAIMLGTAVATDALAAGHGGGGGHAGGFGGGAHMGGCPARVMETFIELGQFAVRTADLTFCPLRGCHCVLYLSIILAT